MSGSQGVRDAGTERVKETVRERPERDEIIAKKETTKNFITSNRFNGNSSANTY